VAIRNDDGAAARIIRPPAFREVDAAGPWTKANVVVVDVESRARHIAYLIIRDMMMGCA